jgi:hypothetical protein
MVGSCTVLMDELQKNGITGFRSVDEVLEYYKSIDFEKSCTYAKYKEQLLQERAALPDEVQQSSERLEKVKADTYASLGRILDELKEKRQKLSFGDLSFFIRLRNYLRRFFLDYKIRRFESMIEPAVAVACESYHTDLNYRTIRLSRLTSDFENAVLEVCAPATRELDRHQFVISGLKPYIYGAIGELKVANTLRRLP